MASYNGTTFPYSSINVSFARYSDNLQLESNTLPVSRRYILVGGAKYHQTELHEVSIQQHKNDNNSSEVCMCPNILFSSFVQDLDIPNGDISKVNFNEGQCVHSYLTQDNKYLIIFEKSFGYNIFDFGKKEWILENNSFKINMS